MAVPVGAHAVLAPRALGAPRIAKRTELNLRGVTPDALGTSLNASLDLDELTEQYEQCDTLKALNRALIVLTLVSA